MNVRRRFRRAAATVALTLLAAPLTGSIAPRSGAIGAETSDVLRVVGELPAPKGPPRAKRAASVVGVDPARRLLFYSYFSGDTTMTRYLATYSLKTRIPTQVGLGKLGVDNAYPTTTRYTVAYDSTRRNLAFVSPALDDNDGHTRTNTAFFAIYSDVSHTVVKRWNLSEKVPGFYPLGVTYSAKDDLYYAVGDFTAHKNAGDGTVPGKAFGPGSGVVAIDPESGAIRFVRVVPECQQVLYSKDIGSLVARSADRPALFFTCVSGGTPSQQTYPGQSGLVRLTVDKNDDTVKAASRPVEFFPISGSYYAGGQASGIAAYDGSTDRFYLQSISFKTPGAWVFDGRLGAWVGFVASPSNANYFIGVNEGSGHLYIGTRRGGQKTDGIVVADVRQTPVPAGEFTPKILTSELISTDPLSNRLFIRPADSTAPHLVIEDLTPVTNGVPRENLDADTSDTPDTPAADVFYGIGATGYAAQSVQVGGTGAPGTAYGPGFPEIDGVAPGTRALMTARVGAIDLRAGGAAASAQAALADINTLREYEGTDPEGDGTGQIWPYPNGTCLDAGGRPVKAEWSDDTGRTAAHYTIECDVAKNHVKSTVRMGASGHAGTAIQKSFFEVVATRNRKDGGIVNASTYADGIELHGQGGFVVHLGRVAATAKSIAHGRPGTTLAEWTREVDGVRVVNLAGTPMFTAPGCSTKAVARAGKVTVTDDCKRLSDAINAVLPTRLRVNFPLPEITATPKGAFAGVEQTEAQYFQQQVVNDQGVVYRGDSVGLKAMPAMITEVYNDTTERSRTVSAFAATQVNSVFQVNPPYDPGAFPGTPGGPSGGNGGGTPGGGVVQPGGPGPGAPAKDVVTPPQAAPQGNNGTGAIPAADIRGFLFMRRSVRDMALLVLLAGLMLGGAGSIWRRRRLVEVLTTVPRKEATL